MSYTVKELFKTLQGEGANVGTVAVFCRFSGCNLWSGHERDRAKAICKFCDTDFVGGVRYATAASLADAIESEWNGDRLRRFVVFTGGEPLLQLDHALLSAVKARGFVTAIETNGTQPVPPGVDWICVSPKADAPLRVRDGSEIKLVYPQTGIDPAAFAGLAFTYFWLSPMDGPSRKENTDAAIAYCLEHPQWRLSLQTHKMVGIR